jgi:hypothetical protein
MLKDLKDMETLSELGVLFLLYEQGLELSLDRLKVCVCVWCCVCDRHTGCGGKGPTGGCRCVGVGAERRVCRQGRRDHSTLAW